MAEYYMPYGCGTLAFRVPDTASAYVANPPQLPALADPGAAIEAALDHPLGSPPLEVLAARLRPRSVCIAFTDVTRACPDHLLVPALVRRLEAAGVAPSAVTLLCVVGMHRPSTPAERVAKLGATLVNTCRVVDHNAQDKGNLVWLGKTPDGIPLTVNRLARQSDLLLATGLVDPHQFAGYSGGGKTVAVGCAGEETITPLHGPDMLDRPGVRLGNVAENPFQAAVRAAAQRAGLRFVLNVVQDPAGNILKVCAGQPTAVHDQLVAFARQGLEVNVPHQFDVAVLGVCASKDTNLYQASRVITYLQLTARPAVRPGGLVVLVASCPEGAGQGPGEQHFLQALRAAPDVEAMLAHMRAHGYPAGAQRAYQLGQVLTRVQICVVGAQDPHVVRDCLMTPLDTVEEALAMAARRQGEPLKVLIVPHASKVLVRVAG